ncbi:MAG: ABC transporter permease [Phyllobacteriaceae bacterium]|nr:ABC transporter permease [Phyllobacteriaceae bacterium]
MRRSESSSFDRVTAIVAGLALILLTAPTLVVLIASFTSGASLRFPPPGLSLRWYVELLGSDDLIDMALRSLGIAVVTAAIAAGLGTSAALALARNRNPWARALDTVFMSPLIVPWIAIGLGILVLTNLLGLPFSQITLVAGHVVVCVPFVLRTTLASLAQIDPALKEASLSLGAGRARTFRRITLPLIAPGIGAGGFLAFVASFDNVPISLFLADARSQMLPIRLWQMIQADLDPRVASISAVVVVGTLVLMLVLERLIGVSRHLS